MQTLQVINTQNQVTFSQEQIDVVKNQIAKNATDMELKSFIYQCERTGLDPFSRQIYFIKGNDGKVQIQTSIDGFRLIAERSDKYEGQTEALWCGADGVWKDIWISEGYPVAAKIGVYKKGFREPLYAIAHWKEYFANPGFMHKKMPALMLSKVAESLALRKAFPNEMSGLYTQEEMAVLPQEEKKTITSTVVAPAKKVTPEVVAEKVPQSQLKESSNQEVDQSLFDQSGASVPHDADFNPNYVCKVGKKYIGQTLDQMGVENVRSYMNYLINSSRDSGKTLDGDWFELVCESEKYLEAKK